MLTRTENLFTRVKRLPAYVKHVLTKWLHPQGDFEVNISPDVSIEIFKNRRLTQVKNITHALLAYLIIFLLVAASLGNAIFSNKSGLSYLPDENTNSTLDDPSESPAGTAANALTTFKLIYIAFCTLGTFILTIGTRAVSVHRQFFPLPNNEHHNPFEANDIPHAITQHQETPLNPLGKSIYYTGIGIARISGIFVALSGYLNGLTLGLSFVELLNYLKRSTDQNAEPVLVDDTTASIIVLAIGIMLAKYLNNFSWNQRDTIDNARRLAEETQLAVQKYREGQNGQGISDIINLPRSPALKTLILTLVGIACVPFNAYFSTNTTLPMLPLIGSKLPENLIRAISSVSAFTSVFSILLTNTPSVYTRLTSRKVRRIYHANDNPRWWLGASLLLILAGTGNFGTIFAGNYAGSAHTFRKNFKVNIDNPAFIAFVILTSLANAGQDFFYSVLEGSRKTLETLHKRKGHQPYTLIEEIEEIKKENAVLIPVIDSSINGSGASDKEVLVGNNLYSLFNPNRLRSSSDGEYTFPLNFNN
ncbi:MAG: hypothetical protein A3J38_03870 [Gammaproteobacteria bacterium RIFCSPHIGHO2_12_FULL_45_9]|nr:MAG: hypothetical protein A3J38_03870 [Gammaproteobacteria bacterium RIFCSPHIGHO2_12_FULL_45_9]